MSVAAMLAVTPLAAWAAAPATNSATPPAPTNTVGPRELRDFNLPGRVTQPATPPASPPVQTPTPTPAPASATPSRDVAPSRAADRPAETVEDRSAPTTVERPFSTDTQTPDFPITAAPSAGAPSIEAPAIDPASTILPPTAEDGLGWWPWLAALAAALGAAAWWWSRRQRQPAMATAAPVQQPRTPTPAPTPVPAARVPAAPLPAPPPTPPHAPSALDGGIVSRRLAPRIQFDFTPLRIDVDGDGNAGLIYDLVIINSGSAPAREVLVEARMFNAGPNQDREIAAFFNAPQALGDRVPLLSPQQRLPVRSRVLLYADRFAPIEVEGRKLLVPMVAFNALYRGPNGEAQNGASFLVGRVPQSAVPDGKMAPFRIDAGARQWSDLGVRPHSGGAG